MQREELERMRRQWKAEQQMERLLGPNSTSDEDSVKLMAQLITKMPSESHSVSNEYEKSLSKELDSMVCPICMENMLPPQHSPMIIIPCGHSFCGSCVGGSEKKARVQKCPVCRSKVEAVSKNIALQNLISIHFKSKTVKATENRETQPENEYKASAKAMSQRMEILETELKECRKSLFTLDSECEELSAFLLSLQGEKEALEGRIRALQNELALVVSHQRENEDLLETKNKERNSLFKKKDLIEGSMKELKLALTKAEAFSSCN